MTRESRLPEKVQVARMALMREFPYLSSSLMAFIPVNEPKCPTMGVDQYWRLYFNEEEVSKWSEDEIKTVLWHEAQHLLSEHHDRARLVGAYDMPWNVAADAEINDDLRKMGFKFPGDCVFPEKIIHKDTKKPMDEWLMAEEYYEGIDIKVVDNCSCGGNSGSETNDQSDQQSGGSGSSDQEQSEDGSKKNSDSGSENSCPMHGGMVAQSSASGMQPAPWEPQEGDESDGTRKVSKSEAEIVRRNTAKAVQDEAQKNIGNVPGFMERWANEKLKPQVPWRQVLRGTLRKAAAAVMGATDYTRSRPARRQSIHKRVVMPSLRQPVPNVAFAIDTSGSMGEKELAAGLAEVKSVLNSMGIRDLTVFSVDHAVGFAQKVTKPQNVKLIGGGGTDMGIAIQQAEQMRPNPDFLVIFTDGYTPWPSKAPDFKVIVVSTTQEKGPDYATTVHIDMERR